MPSPSITRPLDAPSGESYAIADASPSVGRVEESADYMSEEPLRRPSTKRASREQDSATHESRSAGAVREQQAAAASAPAAKSSASLRAREQRVVADRTHPHELPQPQAISSMSPESTTTSSSDSDSEPGPVRPRASETRRGLDADVPNRVGAPTGVPHSASPAPSLQCTAAPAKATGDRIPSIGISGPTPTDPDL